VGRTSLLEQTISRIIPLIPPERIFVITSRHLEREVAKKLKTRKGITVIGEPVGKNTAPAIGLASSLISMKEPDAVTLVLPSDHTIEDANKFLADVRTAVRAAQSQKLVVFGIKPDRPETGYGYIKTGARVPSLGRSVFSVRGFVEKPGHRRAVKLCRSTSHYWNSGIFVWRVDVLLAALRKHLPSLASSLGSLCSQLSGRDFHGRLKRFYSEVEAISIDYGLLERSSNIVMVKAGFAWDDLGSWISLERVMNKDKHGNVLSGDTVAIDTGNCVLFAGSGVLATLGVENLVVVRTENATLVCAKERAQEIKRISRLLSCSRRLKRHL